MTSQTFVSLAFGGASSQSSVAQVLQSLYDDYVGKVEFENADRFHRLGDEIGETILDEEDWFNAILARGRAGSAHDS